METIFSAQVTVETGGYRWQRTSPKGPFKLVPAADPCGVDVRHHDPFQEWDGLFIMAARVGQDPDRSSILKFCNEHGPFDDRLALDDWIPDFRGLHEAVGTLYPGLVTGTEAEPVPGLMTEFVLGSTPKILCDVSVSVCERIVITEGRQRAKIIPATATIHLNDLRQVIWAQLAEAVAEGLPFAECAMCDRAMRVVKGRLFCSGSCRSRFYATRKQEGLLLFYQGATPKEIAKQLDVDVDLAEQWIAADAKGSIRTAGDGTVKRPADG